MVTTILDREIEANKWNCKKSANAQKSMQQQIGMGAGREKLIKKWRNGAAAEHALALTWSSKTTKIAPSDSDAVSTCSQRQVKQVCGM